MYYGVGFATMPPFAADYFGPKHVGPIYGLMLTAMEPSLAYSGRF